VDHEEVDSLPRFIGKGVQYVDFKLALDDTTVQILKLLRDLKLLEAGTRESPGPRRAVLNALPKPADLTGQVEGSACLVVETVGERHGTSRNVTLYTQLSHRAAAERHHATATAHLTGTPAAVAVLLLLTQRIRTRGLLPPESLDPTEFFPMLAERGIPVRSRETVDRPIGTS
jgi:saccharopine dehydrogenase-like NADP-dependent oxidoreductase